MDDLTDFFNSNKVAKLVEHRPLNAFSLDLRLEPIWRVCAVMDDEFNDVAKVIVDGIVVAKHSCNLFLPTVFSWIIANIDVSSVVAKVVVNGD